MGTDECRIWEQSETSQFLLPIGLVDYGAITNKDQNVGGA